MKRKWLIGLLSIFMVLAMCFGFAACGGDEGGDKGGEDGGTTQTTDQATADAAIASLKTLYKDGETASAYKVLGQTKVNGTNYTITWTVTSDDVTNITDYVQIGTMDDTTKQITIDIVKGENKITYKLKATVTVGTASASLEVTKTIPAAGKIYTPSEALALGKALTHATGSNETYYAVDDTITAITVKGYVVAIDTTKGGWNDEHKNLNRVYIGDTAETAQADALYVYRIVSDEVYLTGADSIQVGDLVTLNGALEKYYETVELTYCNQVTPSINVTVLGIEKAGEKTDEEVLTAAKNALKLSVSYFTATGDYNLPATVEGASVAWELVGGNNTNVKVENGKLTVLNVPDTETSYTLKATLSYGSATSVTKEFPIKVGKLTLTHAGTQADPFTPAEAIAIAATVADGEYYSDENGVKGVYVKGKVVDVGSWSGGNFNNYNKLYLIASEDYTKTATKDTEGAILVYRIANDSRLTEGCLHHGDELLLLCGIQNYGGTPELGTTEGASDKVNATTLVEYNPVELTPQEKVDDALRAVDATLTITATGETTLPTSTVEGVTFTWSTDTQLPAGITFDSATGKINVTALPEENDVVIVFTLSAACGTEGTGSKTVTVTVKKQGSVPQPGEGLSLTKETLFADVTGTSYAAHNGTHTVNGASITTSNVMGSDNYYNGTSNLPFGFTVLQFKKTEGSLTLKGTFTKIVVVLASSHEYDSADKLIITVGSTKLTETTHSEADANFSDGTYDWKLYTIEYDVTTTGEQTVTFTGADHALYVKSITLKGTASGGTQGGGEEQPHVCGHVCPICGKCTDESCDNAACADKCEGHEGTFNLTTENLFADVSDSNYNGTHTVNGTYVTTLNVTSATQKGYTDANFLKFTSGNGKLTLKGTFTKITIKFVSTYDSNNTGNKLTVKAGDTALVAVVDSSVKTGVKNGNFEYSIHTVSYAVTTQGEQTITILKDANYDAYVSAIIFEGTPTVGGTVEHVCADACPVCGKCTTDCTDPVCTEKCPKNHNYGTLEAPLSVADVLTLVKDMAAGNYTPQVVYAIGKVNSMGTSKGTYWSNFVLEDTTDAQKTIGAATINLQSGVEEPKAGDEVVICGYISNRSGTLTFASKGSTYVNIVKNNGSATQPQTAQQKVDAALAAVQSEYTVTVAEDYLLPAPTVEGVTFSWVSDNETYKITNGNALEIKSLPTDADVVVHLTLTAAAGEGDERKTGTKQVTITIQKKGTAAKGTTADTPYTVAEAIAEITKLTPGKSDASYSATAVYVQGYVVDAGTWNDEKSDWAKVYISDDATHNASSSDALQLFYLYPDTEKELVPLPGDLFKGAKITVNGYLQNFDYNDGTAGTLKTPEMSSHNSVNVTVVKYEATDEQKVQAAVAAIDLNSNSVTEDVDLPESPVTGVAFSWTVTPSGTNATVEGNKVKITRTESDAAVTLKLTATKGSASTTVDYTLKIASSSTPDSAEVVTLGFTVDEKKNDTKTNGYTESFTATRDNYTFTIENFNNYNNSNTWTYIKTGSKSAAVVGKITSPQMTETITSIVVTIDSVTADLVNSFKLLVADNTDFTGATEISLDIKKGENVFELDDAAAGKYYRIEIDCKKGTGNGFVQISKVVYWGYSAS